ncbi:hypothetical protein Sjap_008949 [Stephania japonica]|uniref:Uncharacterized protein n=1 Tax=Stephania japonica TaxID=461633 RepID=A0AAP0PF49_9MAGN
MAKPMCLNNVKNLMQIDILPSSSHWLILYIVSFILSLLIEDYVPPLCQTGRGVSVSSWKKEFKSVIFKNGDKLPKWIMKVCIMDMNKWMQNTSTKFASSRYMAEILSRRRPSAQALLNNVQQIGRRHSNGYEINFMFVIGCPS